MRHEIDEERLVETFLELIRINSPSFAERELGYFLKPRLESLGCSVKFQEYAESFNIIALKKGNVEGPRPIMLSAHMDTIEPTSGIEYEIKDGVIRSTGQTVLGADDKGAIAQVLEALAVIREKGLPHGDIEIVFTSAEEKGLFGAKNLDYDRLRSRHALVLDASGSVGSVVTAAPSHCTYEMRISGRSAHAGIEPEHGINAIRTAALIIAAVPDGRIDQETTANIGVISGGTATNVVPKETLIRGEMRSRNASTLKRLREEIFIIAEKIAKECGAGLEITSREDYRSFRIDGTDEFLMFIEEVFRSCGINPVHVESGGGADANIFNERGIKALNVSNGMQKVHSTGEYIHVADLINGSRVVLEAVCGFAQYFAGRA